MLRIERIYARATRITVLSEYLSDLSDAILLLGGLWQFCKIVVDNRREKALKLDATMF